MYHTYYGPVKSGKLLSLPTSEGILTSIRMLTFEKDKKPVKEGRKLSELLVEFCINAVEVLVHKEVVARTTVLVQKQQLETITFAKIPSHILVKGKEIQQRGNILYLAEPQILKVEPPTILTNQRTPHIIQTELELLEKLDKIKT